MVKNNGSHVQKNKSASTPQVDAETLAKVGDIFLQIGIVGKSIRMYPSGHPQLQSTLKKTKATLDGYFAENDAVTLGISTDSLIFRETNLSSKNAALCTLAEDLHAFSIYLLTLKPGLAAKEIQQFAEIISADNQGSSFDTLSQMIENADLPHIEAVFLNWNTAEFRDIDEIILEKSADSESSWSDYLQELMRSEVAEGADSPESQEYLEALDMFNRLIDGIRPDLRETLLAKPLTLGDRKPLLDVEMFTRPSHRDVLGVISEINAGEEYFHPYVLRIFDVLSTVCSDYKDQSASQTNNKSDRDSPIAADDMKDLFFDAQPQKVLRLPQLRSKIEALLKKLPPSEQKASLPKADKLASETRKHMMWLLFDLLERERSVGRIQNYCATLLKTLKAIDPEKNLNQLNYALKETLGLVKRLHVPPASAGKHGTSDAEELKTMKKDAIIQHLLVPLDLPGLFSRLAGDRKNPAVKTFCRILELSAEFISDAIVESFLNSRDETEQKARIRLIKANKKHYVPDIKRRLRRGRSDEVIKLLKIVPALGDDELNKEINSLLNNDDLSIKLAALKTLVSMDAPDSLQTLVAHLEDPDRDISMGSMDIAKAKTDAPREVLEALLMVVILEHGPFWRKIDLERKIKAVRTLSSIGNPEVLDGLFTFVQMRHFFRARAFDALKTEIFRGLRGYPSENIKEFLAFGASSKNDDIATICQRMTKR